MADGKPKATNNQMASLSPPEGVQGQTDQSPADGDVETQMNNASSEWSINEYQEIDLKKYIKARTCCCFIKKPNQPETEKNLELCKCNYTWEEHGEDAHENSQASDVKWDMNQHTKEIPTNAYGEIDFAGYGSNDVKYVRVAHDTPMNTMMKLAREAWDLEMPNLLISVTGSATDTSMKASLIESFRRGLMRAVLSTGAWIVTGGRNIGVMKLVGEAVRDFGLTAEGQVVTIGIAGWGTIANKGNFIDEKGENGLWPATYPLDEHSQAGQYLEPHHTHFIMVDNGTQNLYGTEIPFRAKFEEEIGKQETKTGETVPVCLLVLGGGPGSLETVYRAIQSGTPTVVIKGSGKIAEILAFAHEHVSVVREGGRRAEAKARGHKRYLDPRVRSRIELLFKRYFKNVSDVSTYVEWVELCVQNEDLLSVFELDDVHNDKDVDMAILTALLKAKKDQTLHQLKLSVTWDSIDIAKSQILTDDVNWASGQLDDVMLSAIQLNRIDFVVLFLNQDDFNLKDFLTVDRLLWLYNSIPEKSLLYSLLCETKNENEAATVKTKSGSFTLEEIALLIENLTENCYSSKYMTRPDATDGQDANKTAPVIDNSDAAHELFVWAVLMNYHKLSKLFWIQNKECATARALFAQNLLVAMQKNTQDTLLGRELESSADDYGQLSVDLLNTCYKANEAWTHKMLIRRMESWGNTSNLSLALQAENTDFVGQSSCQSYFNKVWHGRMETDNSLIMIMICSILFPFIPWLIKFAEDDTKKKVKGKAPKKGKKQKRETSKQVSLTFCQKIYHFYTSPVVKFCLNVYSYSGFLILYGYILLSMLTEKFHGIEVLLIVWVFTILLEEIRQFAGRYAYSLKSKVWSYFTDPWNILDLVTIVLFIIGYALRFDPGLLDYARIVLSINLITFNFRILHIFSSSKHLGPLLSMIYMMMKDLSRFVVILLVFIYSYAVASEAVLHPESELSWKFLYHLPRKAYWHIYGELFLEDIEGTNDCTNDPNVYHLDDMARCPSEAGKYFVPILLGCYMLMTNVMLLNILIAIFSNIFESIQENVDMYWNLQLFHIVSEYIERPVLPPPVIIISHLYYFGCKVVNMCCSSACKPGEDGLESFCKKMDKYEEIQLMRWEGVIADEYLSHRAKDQHSGATGQVQKLALKATNSQGSEEDEEETEEKTTAISDELKELTTKVESIREKQQEILRAASEESSRNALESMEEKLSTLESQVNGSSKSLKWITAALQELGAKGPEPEITDVEQEEEQKLAGELSELGGEVQSPPVQEKRAGIT